MALWNITISDSAKYRVTAPSFLKEVVVVLVLRRRGATNWVALRKSDGTIIRLSDDDHETLNEFSTTLNGFELTFFPSDGKDTRQPRADAWLGHFLDLVAEFRTGNVQVFDRWRAATAEGDDATYKYLWNVLKESDPALIGNGTE